jgi:DNA ligase-1
MKELMLAYTYDGEDPTGYWMSEKLDGVRAKWTGRHFRSRNGNQFVVPDWFKAGMPDTPLDGELTAGRGTFRQTLSILRRKDLKDWKRLEYCVFALPDIRVSMEDGLKMLRRLKLPGHVRLVRQVQCRGVEHLQHFLQAVLRGGGEGVMLREYGSPYINGRSHALFKVKGKRASQP